MTKQSGNLGEVIQYFFKLGVIAFGGPAAHIAMMQRDLVDQKQWLDQETFLDYMGATSLIPGPNSTEMTMHCGMHRAGSRGLFLGGAAFIFPAVMITLAFAVLAQSTQHLEAFTPIMSGIKAAVLAVIGGAIWKLGKKAITNTTLLALAILVIVASYLGVTEVFCILGAGLLGVLASFFRDHLGNKLGSFLPIFFFLQFDPSVSKIFLIFLKVGAVLFGSGYVLFAYLDGELIQNLGWLTHGQLVEAIAIGQVTPGPVLSTSTYIGYQLGSFSGAAAATLGIFLPSFLFVLLLNPLIPKIRSNKHLSWFLKAVNAAAVAVMLVVMVYMSINVVTEWRTILIAIGGFLVYFGLPKLSSFWIVLGGAVAGYLLSLI